MVRNTIGQFISALRKANGLTQQDVADRLNVSNKAVSRWERDECAPDISLIPALAELLGVTCDELLKGERILDTEQPEKREPKIEKQVRNLINRTLSGFRTLIWISVTVAFIGLVCMFGISYGFFRPVIGFAVMLLLEACAFGIAMVAVNRTTDAKNDNELFKEAEEALTAKYSRQLGSYSYAAFFLIASVILLSLPLVLLTSDYVDSVPALESYGSIFFGIVLFLAVCCLKLKKPYVSWVTAGRLPPRDLSPKMQKVRMMNWTMLGLAFAATLADELEMYFQNEDGIWYITARVGTSVLGIAFFVCPIVFLLRYRDFRKDLLLPGIRNILMTIPMDLLMRAHWVWWSGELNERLEVWDWTYFWWALEAALLLVLAFELINTLLKRKKQQNQAPAIGI